MSIFGNSMSTYMEDMMLNEAYIGKTPILEEISKRFQAIIDEGPTSFYKNMSRDKRIIEINRLFEKQFGMDLFSLRVENSEELNAYTIVIGTKFEVADKYADLYEVVECNPTRGYYFKPGNNLCITEHIYTGLLFSGLSGDEITAILLHETGHNFADALYGDIYIQNREASYAYKRAIIMSFIIGVITAPALIGIPMIADSIKSYKMLSNKSETKTAKKDTKKAGKTGGLKAIIAGVKAKAVDYLSYVEELSYRLADYTGIKIPDPTKGKGKKEYESYKKSLQRINEVFADKFATMYGYGPELATSLSRMGDYLSRANKEIQTSRSEEDKKKNLKYEELARQASFFDEHPRLIQRINSNINLLERELKKDDLDPKYKKMLEDQLKQLKVSLKEFTEANDKLSKNDNARRIFNAYVQNALPDAVDAEIEEKIEQALDRGFEDYKKNIKK